MRTVVFALVLFAATYSFAGSNATFDQLKALAGDWKGVGPDGKEFTVSYQLVSGGTAILERLNEGQMVTAYYPDGNDVMLTHYCMANNQPRMKAQGMNGKTIDFQFVDATNLGDSSAGHMHGMKLTIEDADHIQENWTWSQMGKAESHAFNLQRVK